MTNTSTGNPWANDTLEHHTAHRPSTIGDKKRGVVTSQKKAKQGCTTLRVSQEATVAVDEPKKGPTTTPQPKTAARQRGRTPSARPGRPHLRAPPPPPPSRQSRPGPPARRPPARGRRRGPPRPPPPRARPPPPSRWR
ncbi:hypothetical protein BU14_2951s0001 [Porphyra umbilicalis]|uniref:Uncharacterized protein n=1 Tax=Porphyra umbilicalis TaxID=2786 RepID=A0A1X6NIH1_PORUM|nr:hypothetical protein BU14_2951s0001 [Porphyra umbilicalis]|eukprot:OSX68352.1 hypothetical protein BU14_2951s0001 [Porphyra umbilicalis]